MFIKLFHLQMQFVLYFHFLYLITISFNNTAHNFFPSLGKVSTIDCVPLPLNVTISFTL